MIDNMSLLEMKKYFGRQTPPEDIDLFWGRQIEKLPKNMEYTLTKKEFNIANADCYELIFEGLGGSKVYAKCVFPKSTEPSPVIFNFHGYQGQSQDWSESLKYVCAGYGLVSMDVRGQSGKSEDLGIYTGNTVKGHILRGSLTGRDDLYYKNVYLDTYQLVEIVSNFTFVDQENLASFGFSQGGALALVCASLNKKITKTVAVYPFLSDFKRVLELGNNSEAYDELFRYFKFKDPLHLTESKILDTLAYIDVKNLVHRMQHEVLMLTGLEDDVCPPSTQFAIYNRITSSKSIKILPEYGHVEMNVLVPDLIYDYLTNSSITKDII